MEMRPGDIPDICEVVTYKGTQWRVTGFYKRNPDYVWKMGSCIREEAELIALYAICGALVKPTDVERSFQYVEWTDEHIRREMESVQFWADDENRFLFSDLRTSQYFDDLPPEPTLEEKMDNYLKRIQAERIEKNNNG